MVFEIYLIFDDCFCDYKSGIVMYLIQDYSHVKRHLKVEHIFSSKKYPIYYSYDQQTFQTYLTKVINNRNVQIINYYKYHINENILPYLKMKSNSSKPSNLRLPEDNPQIMIKINQIEKERNIEKLRDKIANHLKQLRTFKLIKNMEFKNELHNLEQFIKRIHKPQEKIQRMINQAQSSVSKINNLHQQFSVQQITPQLSQRLQQQMAGEELAIVDQLRLFNSLSEFQAKNQRIVWQDIKLDRSEQMKKSIQAFFDATHQCISCLNIHENYLNIEEIFQMLKSDQGKLKEQQRKIYEANVLYINRKFIKGNTLRQMILSKDSRITPLFCRDLSKNIVDFILRDGGVRNLFITSENIIVEDFGKFHINYFSFVGLEFVKLQKYVSKRELQQILPYLTSNYIDIQNSSREMDLQMFLRFIVVNFVSAYFKKDIVYDYQKVDFQVEVRRDRVERIIKKINNELLPDILAKKDLQDLSQNFDRKYFVNYTKLAQHIFAKQSKVKLTWEYILSLMGCTIPMNNYTSNLQQKQFTLDDVLNYLLKYLTNPSAKCYDWLSINIFQAFNHFIDILKYFMENVDIIEKADDSKYDKEKQDNKVKHSEKRRMFQKKNLKLKLNKMKTMSKQLSTQREYFKNKGRYCHTLYLPIKCRFTFCKILDYHNWIGLLAGQKNPDSQTYQAAQNLFHLFLEIQQTMIFLSDYINDEIIQQTLLLKKRTFKDKQNIKKTKYQQQQYSSQKNTYSHILRYSSKRLRTNKQQDVNIEQDNSDGDYDNSQIIKQEYSLKDITLQSFFKSTKILFLILKYYFRNMNEISVSDLKIHDGFSKTLESFVPYEYFHNQNMI